MRPKTGKTPFAGEARRAGAPICLAEFASSP